MKKILSLVLALTLVLGTMIVPAFAATSQTFKMVDYITDANAFATDGDWLVARTKIGQGDGLSISGAGAGTTLGITRNKDEAFIVTVNFKTGSKPTSAATKSSFNVRLNLNGSLGASEWFHPFEVYVDSTLDNPRLQFASNADKTDFYPATLDGGKTLTLEYNKEYVLKTAIAENAEGYADFTAELYSASNGEKGDLIDVGEVSNLKFSTSLSYKSEKFDVLTLCERFSVMSLSHYTAPTVEEPVAYIGNLTFETGVYTKPEAPAEKSEVKFDSAVYSEVDTVFENEMTMDLSTMQRYGYDQYKKYYAPNVAADKWTRYTWNNIPVESSFVQDGDMIAVRPLNTANGGSATDSYNSYCYAHSGILIHSFAPVTDGSEFAVRMTVHPYKPSAWPNKAFAMHFRLVSADANAAGDDSAKTFTIFSWGGSTETKLIAGVASVNVTDKFGHTMRDNDNYLAKSAYGYDVNLQNQDIDVEARFVPNGDNYNVYVTCTDASGKVLLANETPAVIPKSEVATYSRFSLNTSYEQTTANTTENLAVRYIGLKNVKIAKGDFSSELSAGSNTFYIPYKRTSGDYLNATVVAAVYDNEDNLVKADAQILENITSDSGYVTVNVDVAQNQYVKYFVLDNFDDLTPLNKAQKALTIK